MTSQQNAPQHSPAEASSPGKPHDPSGSTLPPCARCGHPPDWHRLDDRNNVSPTDPEAQFRCLGYDCEAPGSPPDVRCWCHDYSDEFIRLREAFRAEPLES